MNVLLVLSSKLVDKELEYLFGKIPTALIPLEGKVAFDYIYEQNYSNYDKIYLITFEKSELIKEHIKNKNYSVELIKLDNLKDIGYTVKFALDKITKSENINNLTINFADTLLNSNNQGEFLNRNIFLYSKTKDSERWTTFDMNNELNVYDKKNLEDKEFYNSFIGIFNFKNIKLFKKLLESNINCNIKMDSFYKSIIEYDEKSDLEAIEVNDWLDLGHEDNYYSTKKNVETRYFNTIEIDKKRGILTKNSKEVEKFIGEIKWYLKLPTNLQYLSPRIFDYSLDFNNPYVKMEYYSYNTLHDMFVYGNYTLNQWRKIFKSLFEVNKDLKKYKIELDKVEIKEALKTIYYEKTVSRLEKLKKDRKFEVYFDSDIIINSKRYRSLNYYLSNLEKFIENMDLYNLKDFNIIHGDFFFANILYDPRSNIIRLIDPRGDFGGYGIYGDNRYELAKLSHSVDGKYDFIVEDLFKLKSKENKINYKIYSKKRHEKIRNLYYDFLEGKQDIKQIKFIQSLLFLSMIPLHSDYPEKQKVMLATGIELINEVI